MDQRRSRMERVDMRKKLPEGRIGRSPHFHQGRRHPPRHFQHYTYRPPAYYGPEVREAL